MALTLEELARVCGAEVEGRPDCKINAVNTLKSAKEGDISFLSNRHYADVLSTTKASAVILTKDDLDKCPTNALVSSNPYLAYAKVANHLYPKTKCNGGINANVYIAATSRVHETAYISSNVSIGENVVIGKYTNIGPGCVIEDNVSIGNDCSLIANVTLCHDIVLGDDVTLHPGVVIGADGFGIAQTNGKWLKIPQIGSVNIMDDVEVGANSTIDRGAIEDTLIRRGVKIDNQVQIGHNVIIGEDTAIAGCTAIAGSVIIGKRCQIGGASAISGHIEITDDVIITGMSAVANSITTAGVYSSGIPITENKVWRRNVIRFKQLDQIIKKITKRLDER